MIKKQICCEWQNNNTKYNNDLLTQISVLDWALFFDRVYVVIVHGLQRSAKIKIHHLPQVSSRTCGKKK